MKLFAILCLGFSSGLPISLVSSTLQAWLASEHIDLALIGFFSLVRLPYNLKFLWAPFMDRWWFPFLGRRRSWILIAQLALILGLIALGLADPGKHLSWMAVLAVGVAIASASQDIVIDAFKTEILSRSEFGIGAASANMGYRLAMLFSGAVALILSDHMSWRSVYFIMAASLGVGILANLLTKEKPFQESAAEAAAFKKITFVEPFLEFLRRKGSFEILSFIIVYKMDVVFTLALMTPFLMDLGFTKTDIGAVTKGFGLVATLTGTFAGGAWMVKLGLKKSLWTFGILQAVSTLCFYSLSLLGHHYPMMVATIAAENFFSGMGNAAYAAFLMNLCHPRYTATQYALLSALMALTQTLAGAPSGLMVKSLGWSHYFLASMALGLPGLLLLLRYSFWEGSGALSKRVES